MGPTTLNPDFAYGRLAWHTDPNMTSYKAGFVIARLHSSGMEILALRKLGWLHAQALKFTFEPIHLKFDLEIYV